MSVVSAVAPKRGSYSKSAAIRERVLDVCVEAFAVSGFYGATMKDIAARAGMSHTGLLHHFPTKEELLLAVLANSDERGRALVEASIQELGRTPENSLRSMLKAVIENERKPGLTALHATLSAEATNPEHPAYNYFRNRYRVAREFYESRFEEMAARGNLTTTMTPRTLALTFTAILDGLQIQWLYEGGDFRMESVIDEFLNSISNQNNQPLAAENQLEEKI